MAVVVVACSGVCCVECNGIDLLYLLHHVMYTLVQEFAARAGSYEEEVLLLLE